MRQARVVFECAGGARRSVPAGGIIGRLSTAALRLEDPRISEAHALVSLRGRSLVAVALRGAIATEGRRHEEVPLTVGRRLTLAPGVDLVVDTVELPTAALALDLGSGALHELFADVHSLLADPLRMEPRYADDAVARVWPEGVNWRLSIGGERPSDVVPGRVWTVAGQAVTAVELPLSAVAVNPTERRGQVQPALTLVAAYSSATLTPEGRTPVVIDGMAGRILAELAEYAEPVEWSLVAAEIWPEEKPENQRANLDRNLRTLRNKLKDGRIREDLVRFDGHGNIELFLLPGDVVRARV